LPYNTSMPDEERAAFLAEVHVAVLAVNEPGRGPLALPIWYHYVDGELEFGLDSTSRKAELLRAAGRATIIVQDEAPPYRYVSVEGPVAFTSAQRDVLAIATRYLGPEFGAWYAEQNPVTEDSAVVRLTPEHWRTQNFSSARDAAPDVGTGV
jgi:nitroimidazol reductase NimA-like FMN-containing flavoprotein (pyridoxamine 5'-phosphate oxidase superfamily)